MKKGIAILLALTLICTLFIACANEPQSANDNTVSAVLDTKGGQSRALQVENEKYDYSKKYSELYWTYTAVKQDNLFKTGETTTEVDLNGGEKGLPTASFGKFSVGKWKFVINGYTDQGKTQKEYTGKETFVRLDSSNNLVSFNVQLSASIGTEGTLLVKNIKFQGTNSKENEYANLGADEYKIYVQLDDGEETEDVEKSIITETGKDFGSLSVGYHSLVVTLRDTFGNQLAKETRSFLIRAKLKTTINGTIVEGTLIDGKIITTVVTKIDDLQKTINSAKVGSVIYIPAGTYDVSNDITIGKNITILGDAGHTILNFAEGKKFVISEELGDDDVTLSGLTINGVLHVKGGGSNSIHLENTSVDTVELDKEITNTSKQLPRLDLKGSDVKTLKVVKAAILEADAESVVSVAEVPKEVSLGVFGENQITEVKGDGAIAEANGGSGTEADPYVIDSAEQFRKAFTKDVEYVDRTNAPKVYYKLTNDLSVDGSVAYYLNNVVLDGGNHKLSIYNFELLKPSDYLSYGVFYRLDHSTIKNLVYHYQYKALVLRAGRGEVVLDNVIAENDKDFVANLGQNDGIFVTFGAELLNTADENLKFISCINKISVRDNNEKSPYFGIFVGCTSPHNYKKTYTFDNCRNEGNIETAGNIGVLIGNVYKPATVGDYTIESQNKLIVNNFVNTGNVIGSESTDRVNSLLTIYESVNKNADINGITGGDKVITLKNPNMTLTQKKVSGDERSYGVSLGSLNNSEVNKIEIQGIVTLVYFNSDGSYAGGHNVNHPRLLSTGTLENGTITVTVPTNKIIGSHDENLIASKTDGIATLNDNSKAVYFERPDGTVCANAYINGEHNHKSDNGVGSFDRFKLVAYDASGKILGTTFIEKDANGYPVATTTK